MNCTTCRKPVGSDHWHRKSNKRKLFFCSLECNVKNLQGNALSNKPEKQLAQLELLAEGIKQLSEEVK